MKSIPRFILLSSLLGVLSSSASAATIQISVTNISPVGSLGFEAIFNEVAEFQLTGVSLIPSGGTMEVLPVLTLQLGVSMPITAFPGQGFGSGLPGISPGDSFVLTLEGVDLTAERALQFGVTLFTESVFADAAGNLIPLNRTVTAGEIAEFADDGNGNFELVIPGGPPGGPAGIASDTGVLSIAVIPEPSAALLGIASGIVFTLRRRRH